MNRPLIFGLWIAATGSLALGIYLTENQSNFRVPSVPIDSSATQPARPFSFALLPAPQALSVLHFTDGEGRAMTLADFKGRFVLLNIWATWCVPCRTEMPTLDRLQAKLGGADFEVVALSIDQQGLPAVRSFFEEIKIKTLGIYVDQSGKAAPDLNAFGLPTTLLIDRQGQELGRLIGPAEWDSPEAISFIERAIGAASPSERHANRAAPHFRLHDNVKTTFLRSQLTFQRWEGLRFMLIATSQ